MLDEDQSSDSPAVEAVKLCALVCSYVDGMQCCSRHVLNFASSNEMAPASSRGLLGQTQQEEGRVSGGRGVFRGLSRFRYVSAMVGRLKCRIRHRSGGLDEVWRSSKSAAGWVLYCEASSSRAAQQLGVTSFVGLGDVRRLCPTRRRAVQNRGQTWRKGRRLV